MAIIDNEALLVDSLRYLLEAEGADVLVIDCGHTAIDTLAEEIPDLVILDITLENLSGFGVLKSLRYTDHPAWEVPVIMWTRSAHQEDMAHAAQFNIHSYCLKSRMPLGEFVDHVATVLV